MTRVSFSRLCFFGSTLSYTYFLSLIEDWYRLREFIHPESIDIMLPRPISKLVRTEICGMLYAIKDFEEFMNELFELADPASRWKRKWFVCGTCIRKFIVGNVFRWAMQQKAKCMSASICVVGSKTQF